MFDDIQDLKNRLPEFLRKEGIEFDASKKNPLLQCPDPSHGDKNASANLYDDERVSCHGCGKTWDIFDVAGLLTGKTEFIDQKKYVLDSLGMDNPDPKPRKTKAPTVQATLCPLSIEAAREVYTREALQRFGDYLKVGEFKKVWLFKNNVGLVQLVEARYETPEKKSVISIYWDGKTLKSKNYPVLMYNADKLAGHDGPILIVEGAKCADAAADIQGFLTITWNGGGKKASKINWSVLKNRKVYIWPDDDRHKDQKTGELIREDLQVGMQTAFSIQKKIPGSKIIPPLQEARKIKSSGADIVEALQIKTTEQIRKYILESEPYIKMSERPLTFEEVEKAPFKILGLSDSGVGHIISAEDRLLPIVMTAITKTHLLNIADITYWEVRFGDDRGKIDWESALNQMIRMVTIADFDSETIRGRGAWIEKDGRICYHDGKVTTGEMDDKKLYLRKNPKDIGIGDPPADPAVCKAISSVVSRMSFESSADTVRLLGWTALAPFAGALPWRPSGLVTGDHQTGKSAILEYVIKPLAAPLCFSGGGTTEAGVRQKIANDSAAVCLDEADDDTLMKKRNKQALLSLMRQSTSNDAPIVAKGTQNQTGLSFQMRSMFLFLAISPEIEHAADDSRIFRVNTVKPDASLWPPIRDSLTELITESTCRGVRARTWGMLSNIIGQVDRVANIIQDETNQSHRFCLSEAMLITAYWMVWQDMIEMTDAQILNGIKVHFAMSRMESPRDETGEIIDRLLDERVLVEKPERRHMTIREMLIAIHKESVDTGGAIYDGALSGPDLMYLKNTVAGLGFAVVENGNVAIASNHHEISKISGHARGYNRQIQRHSGLVEAARMLYMAGKYRECIILSGIVNGGEG